MEIRVLCPNDELWRDAQTYAASCSWSGGTFLAGNMEQGRFDTWERVLVAREHDAIVGFCSLTKTDCMPHETDGPYIGSLFVDPEHRGRRLSEQMINAAATHARQHGFERVYVCTGNMNFYEKFGFTYLRKARDIWGHVLSVYERAT